MNYSFSRKAIALVALLAFVLLASLPANAAPLSETPAGDNPYDLVPSTRVDNMRVSIETGQPLVLYMVNYPVNAGTPEEMARQYLRENARLLQLNDVNLADLTVRHVRDGLSGYVVRFDQYYAGIPVYKGEIAVHINNDNLVTYVANDYQPNIDLAHTAANVAPDTARAAAHAAIGVAGELRFDKTTLVIQGGRLAYEVRAVASGLVGDWQAFVDATTGEVYQVANIAHSAGDDKAQPTQMVDGTGMVWDPDPLTSATATYGDPGFTDNNDADTPELNGERVSVNLLDIQFSGGMYTLISPHSEIVDSESPFNGLFAQATDTFNFTRSQDAFEAVTVFYHIDSSMRYLNNTLGLNIVPFQYAGGPRFDPHGLGGADNSHYIGSTGEVAFGEGGVDDSEDSDVIHHELGHGLHDWVTNGSLSQVNGLSEGSGDYWAQSYNRSVDSWTPADPAYNWVFRWDGHNEFWNGRVTNYPNVYPGGLVGQIHTDGQIWSTCMMKVWDAIGKTKTDTIFWEGLGMTNGSTNQEDAAIAVYQAALDLGYSAADRQAIRGVFDTCVYNIPEDPFPSFSVAPVVQAVSVCAGEDAVFPLNVTAINGWTDPVTLSSANEPAGSSVMFNPNPVVPTGMSTMTVSSLVNAGMSTIDITGTFGITTAHTTVDLTVSDAAPGAATLNTPADGATNVANPPSLQWTAAAGASDYLVEVATDAGFTNVVYSAIVNGTSTNATGLATGTTYYWRVTASNGCGAGAASAIFSFTTLSAPGDCGPGTVPDILYSEDFEAGEGGWTHDAAIGPDTWAVGAGNGNNGSAGFHADDVGEESDQRLTSPLISLPTGQSPLTFQFFNYQELEDGGAGCYDGGVLEISTDGTTWTRLESELLTDPYDGEVDSGFNNPLAGSNAWCGDPQNWLNSIVDLDAYAGQDVQLRMRLGTDSSVDHPGWDIDDVKVQSCVVPPPPPMPSIVMTATVGTTSSCATGDMATLPPGGGTAYYCYSVENTGNVTLTNHTISDTEHGMVSMFMLDLAPGASESVVVPISVTMSVTSTATWHAEEEGVPPVRGLLFAEASDDVMVFVEPDVVPTDVQFSGFGETSSQMRWVWLLLLVALPVVFWWRRNWQPKRLS